MDNPETITVLSLCTGYGGLELGLSRALSNPMRVVAVEVEAYAAANLVAKAEEGKLAIEALWPDLRTFPAERFRGCFDIILAGYPCQPFSCAGKRKGESDSRHLWPHIAGIVQAVRPVWCGFENVSGHLTLGFPEVYRSLRIMGYKVEAGIFSAAECGAPHRRERLFILGHTKSDECIAKSQLRSYETTGNHRRAKESAKTRQSQGTNRPLNVSSIQGGTSRSKQLADSESNGRQGSKQYKNQGQKRILCPTQGSSITKWPSRPGQPQYEWEEPRVVANTKVNRTQNGCERQGRICPKNTKGRVSGLCGISSEKSEQLPTKGPSQPRLGGTANGFNSRVDRLRLLGNGVIPQCAEKAFRELMALKAM